MQNAHLLAEVGGEGKEKGGGEEGVEGKLI